MRGVLCSCETWAFETDLRCVHTNMGAELTGDEVSDLVRVIRDAGLYIGDEGCGYDDNKEL